MTYSRLLSVWFATLATFALWTPASLAQPRPHPRPSFKILAKPAAVDAGSTATVSGKVNHASKDLIASLHVDIQSKTSRGFTTLASTKPSPNGRFTIVFRVPETTETLGLRLQLRRGKHHHIAVSKVWKMTVSARKVPVGGSPSPRPTQTIVVAPGTVVSVPEPGQAGTVRIAGQPELEVGDILVVGLGPNTPNGFLGRITSVTFDGSETMLETVPATLPEALPQGEFAEHIDGGELDSAEESGLHRNNTTVPGSAHSTSSILHQHVSTVLHCNAGAEVTVSGSVSINPRIDIEAGWGFLSGLHARFVGEVSASTELAANAEAAASCKIGPTPLFTRVLSPIEFSVGPIPVVVVPKITAYLSADGKVEASVASEVHGSVTASAGIEYSHGSPQPVADFEKSFGWTPPEPQGTAHLGATVSPTIDLLVYGLGGPEAAFNVGLAVDANAFEEPAWKLTAPISLTAKLAIPSLGISTPTLTVYQHVFLLAQAEENQAQGQIHFDELPEGTVVTDQYANEGVIFDSSVFITSDLANPTSPVLSGTPLFEGPIVGHFVEPGTETPTTVNLLQLDAGYIDNPGSIEIVATLANGKTRTALADHLGIDQISIATRGIKSFSVQAVSTEEAGFAIDNLGFGR